MLSVGVRELKQRATELIRMVREESARIQVTYYGKVVALLVPVPGIEKQTEESDAWVEMDLLAAEIGAKWPAGVSAAEAVNEDRR